MYMCSCTRFCVHLHLLRFVKNSGICVPDQWLALTILHFTLVAKLTCACRSPVHVHLPSMFISRTTSSPMHVFYHASSSSRYVSPPVHVHLQCKFVSHSCLSHGYLPCTFFSHACFSPMHIRLLCMFIFRAHSSSHLLLRAVPCFLFKFAHVGVVLGVMCVTVGFCHDSYSHYTVLLLSPHPHCKKVFWCLYTWRIVSTACIHIYTMYCVYCTTRPVSKMVWHWRFGSRVALFREVRDLAACTS